MRMRLVHCLVLALLAGRREMAKQTQEPKRMTAFCPRSLLMLLWERARLNLTEQELQWVVDGVSDFTNMHAARLEAVLDALGGLVACDKEAGSFRSADDLSDLLFLQSDSMSMIGGMAYAAGLAAMMLAIPLSSASHSA